MGIATEQGALKLSIAVTVMMGMVGIIGGFMTGSQAIMFDGMYSFVDVMLTTGSLAVSNLLRRAPTRRFQFGYWHLEPLAGIVQSAILTTACVYALVNAVQGLIGGGHPIAFGFASVMAGVLCVTGIAMAAYVNRLARAQNSTLLAIDARSWLLSGLLSLALLLSYALALILAESRYSEWVPLIDPMVLVCVSLAILPIPLGTLWGAARDVLQVAPQDLDLQVRAAMDEIIREREFLGYSSHVAQIGRAKFVEIHILVSPDLRIGTVGSVDALRREIATRLDAAWPEAWLTVDLTADPAWM